MMSRNTAIAESLTELAAELDEQRTMLQQIKDLCITLSDGQNELRSHALDTADRQGTRLLNSERRLAALELSAGVNRGGE